MSATTPSSEPLVKDTTLLIGFGALLGAAGAFHAGAALAAFVTGHGAFRASLSDSAVAFVRIVGHHAPPEGAWTGSSAGQVPNGLVFWSCEVVVLAAVVGVSVLAYNVTSRRRPTSNGIGVRKHAGFAQVRDLRRLVIERPSTGRLTLGRAGRKLVAAEAQASLAVVGPTGCGKTAGFAIPAILEWDGPLIATSVKADLIASTIEHRRSRGRVWVYDPTSCSGQLHSSWTPLTSCDTWAGAQRMASWLCEAAQAKLDSVSDGDYWYTQARKALAPYLYAAAITDRSMSDVVAWIDTQERDQVETALRDAARLDDEIKAAERSPHGQELREVALKKARPRLVGSMRDRLKESGDEQLAAAVAGAVSTWPTALRAELEELIEGEVGLSVSVEIEMELLRESSMRERLAPLVSAQSTWMKDARLRDSVFATIQNVLAGYADPVVGGGDQEDAIDFDEWLRGDNTIYVVATSHEQARLRPVLTTLVQQAIRAAFDGAMVAGGALGRPCLVLLDEAGNTAPLRDLPAYASTARSHNITLVSIWQDLAQIKSIYKDRSQTVLNNHRAKLFGTGIADEATLGYLSRLVGEVGETERNVSRDASGVERSVSEHVAYRRAAPVDVLRRIKPNEAVLIYGSELPAHLHLRPWFKDDALRRRAEAGSTDGDVAAGPDLRSSPVKAIRDRLALSPALQLRRPRSPRLDKGKL